LGLNAKEFAGHEETLGEPCFDKREASGVEWTSTRTDMSTTEIRNTVEELLRSFDVLSEDEKHQAAKAILLRSLDLEVSTAY
jgi:hypothetical protein